MSDVKGHERDEDPRMSFLREIAAATVEASRVRAGESVVGMPANTTGGPLVRPGGRGAYPAFWVRDFAMSLDSGLLTNEECLHGLEMIARTQYGPDIIRMDTGATVPP